MPLVSIQPVKELDKHQFRLKFITFHLPYRASVRYVQVATLYVCAGCLFIKIIRLFQNLIINHHHQSINQASLIIMTYIGAATSDVDGQFALCILNAQIRTPRKPTVDSLTSLCLEINEN